MKNILLSLIIFILSSTALQAQFLTWQQAGNLPVVNADGGDLTQIIAGKSDTVFAFLSYKFPYGMNVHDEIYISTDKGITWKDTKQKTPFTGITMISKNGAFLHSSSPNDLGINGIYRSTNMGTDWSKTLNVNGVYSLIRGKDQEYYAVTSDSSTNNIFHSVDDGLTWEGIILPAKYSGSELFYKDSGTLFLHKYEKIYRSSDYGVTWDSVFSSKNTTPFFACDHSIVYAQNDSGDVYISSSGSKGTWVKRATDLFFNVYSILQAPAAIRGGKCFSSSGYITEDTGNTWREIVFYPFGPNYRASCVSFDSLGICYAGGSDYVLRSFDTCRSWTSISLPISDSASNYLLPLAATSVSSLWALYGLSLFHSPDDGYHWNKIIPKAFKSVYSIGSGGDGSLLAGVLDSMHHNIVVRTTDNGNSWSLSSPIKPDNIIDYVGETSPGKIIAIDDAGYCHHSEDNGMTWKVVQVEYQPTTIYSFCMADALTLYAGSQGGFSVSHDGGNSWRAVTLQVPTTLVTSIAPSYGGDVVAVFDTISIMRSSDGGKSWIPQNSGFPKNIKITGLVADIKQNVYAATNKGTFLQFTGDTVWRGSTSGLTDQNVTSITSRNGNTLFVSCSHSEIFRAENITGAVRSINKKDNILTIYPNPISSSATISYSLSHPQFVKLEIIDQLGRIIETIQDGTVDAGLKSYPLSVINFPAGMYYLRMQNNDSMTMQKVVVTK